MTHTFRSLVAMASMWLLSVSTASADVGGGELVNPLTVNNIAEFISKALKVLVMVALPIITLFIVYAGFMFVIARGNETMLSEAKRNFFYVIVGAILILGAWVIATLIGGTVTQLTSGS